MIRTSRDEYEKSLRKLVILDYIDKNKSSPKREELFELMRIARKKYPNLDNIGFSGYEVRVPSFKDISSSEMENSNNSLIRKDFATIIEKLSGLSDLIEDHYRSFKATVDKAHKLNSSIEAKLNNLLLLSGRTDVFVAGIEETFDTNEFIQQDVSDVEYNPGYITLGRERFIPEMIDSAKFKVRVHAPKGKLGSSQKSTPRNLLYQDGSDWILYVYTSYAEGDVFANIEVDLTPVNQEGIYVGDVRLSGDPLEVNGKMDASIHYTTNGWDYNLLEPSNIRFEKGENLFSVGKEDVKKLKISLRKTAADTIDGNRSVYIFSLDSLEILTGTYTAKTTSTLVAGPYEVLTDTGEPVNFSLATMVHGTCCIVPSETSVDFFLSKDGVNWYPTSYLEDSIDVVHFSGIANDSIYVMDEDKSDDALIMDNNIFALYDIDTSFGTEALLNAYVPAELADKFVLQNTIVKRNLRQRDVNGNLYEFTGDSYTTCGWFKDQSNLRYKTTIYVDSFEGAVLNLGGTSAYLNGRLVTGEVVIPQGYHDFATNYSNWQTVEPGLEKVDLLQEKDKLYPFNHKYMIEGYAYPPFFEGEKVYNSTGRENFGASLEYVSPERFNSSEFDNNLYIYTVEEYNENLFFKVKVQSNNSNWVNELVDVDYMLRTDDLNTVYVKAILRTSNTAITPHINKFQVRVI